MINCIFDLFKLHRANGEYKMEIIREPIMDNVFIDLSEDDFNRLYDKYHYMKGLEDDKVIVFQENLFDDTRIYNELKQEYRREFREYYMD